MRIKIFILQLLLQMTFHSHAQEIRGTVTTKDAKGRKEPLVSAKVDVRQAGKYIGGCPTDFDGNYSVKPLDTGYYDVTVTFIGYDTQKKTRVIVSPGEVTTLNFSLTPEKGKLLQEVQVKWKRPLTDPQKHSTILTAEEIKNKPTTQTTDMEAMTPGVYRQRRGQSVNSAAPGTANVYVIDGIQVQGAVGIDMSQGRTQQINAVTTMKPVYMNPSAAEYKKVQENDFRMVKSSPLSTMSVDVDRASYSNMRRFINYGQNPPPDAVRIEEMVNYFTYDYPQPDGKAPIAIQTELTPCPWNSKHDLLRIGMQAKKIAADALPPSNLVFLIDVSGSMNEPNRLPLVKGSLRILVNKLRKDDKVSLVVYAGNAGLVLPATAGDQKQEIMTAIDRLEAGGSTAGGAGIELAYRVAADNFIKGGNNRVILATDGDFNVGVSIDNDLETLITEKRKSGIFLTCLGVGDDNYKDAKMEMLADKGNGNYDYLDNIEEAEKMLDKEFTGTMFTVAKDVKAQIEFNPERVQSYRLVGYENRVLNTEDFKDDKKDAGDMGAGHMVTILYELVPADIKNDEARPNDDLKYQKQTESRAAFTGETATIKFRYKDRDDSTSKELKHIVKSERTDFDSASASTRFASSVALFGMILRESSFKGKGHYRDVLTIAENSLEKDPGGYRAEFVSLVKAAKANAGRTSAR